MTVPRPPVTLIAAVARNRVIGRGNTMPWRLPGDMAHFRAATMGRPVVMGRRTYESIGVPLPGRPIVVVSRDPGFVAEGVTVVADPVVALDRAAAIAALTAAPEIMVAGGGAIYAALIARADRLLLTEVNLEPLGDTMFPTIDIDAWREIERIAALPVTGDDASYSFVRYARRR